MHYKNKLFREADELSEKISEQIRDCNRVRSGIREQVSETRKLIDLYNNEEEQFNQRMQYRKQVYSNSKLQYNEFADRNLQNFKKKGCGNGGGCTSLTALKSLSPYGAHNEFFTGPNPLKQTKNFLLRRNSIKPLDRNVLSGNLTNRLRKMFNNLDLSHLQTHDNTHATSSVLDSLRDLKRQMNGGPSSKLSLN